MGQRQDAALVWLEGTVRYAMGSGPGAGGKGQGPRLLQRGSAAGASRYARRIPDLRPGEMVVVLLHEHPVALLSSLAWPLVLLLGWLVSIFFVVPFLDSLQVDPFLSANPPPAWLAPLLWTCWLGMAVLAVCWIAYTLLDWKADWIALTTRRVIVMSKRFLVSEARRECPIGKVQNVLTDFSNPVGMAFDFGTLTVDTAGAGTISFKNLPHPKLLREAIFAQQEVLRAKQPPPEDIRKAAVRSIILGIDPLPKGNPAANTQPAGQSRIRNPRAAPNVSGYGLFNSLFPYMPQRDGETVTWRRHWSYLLRGVLLPVLIYGLVLGMWFVSIVSGQPGVVGPVEMVLGWAALGLLPVCAGWAVWNWEQWCNDLYRLDHERIYHIQSLPFGLREQSKETLLGKISDVMYEVPGPMANLLNYGNVVIKTPGEATEFDFHGIPCPREVQQEIMDKVDASRQRSAAGTDKDIEAWLKAYHDVMRGA